VPDAVGESRALYYPFIDVNDPGWLKSACLFWDEVSTIVPTGYGDYYTSDDASALATEGWLTPLAVKSRDSEVYEASSFLLGCLQDERWTAALRADVMPRPGRASTPSTMPLERLHSEKLSPDLLSRLGIEPGPSDPWLSVPKAVSDLYMAVLAAEIGRRRRFAVVTDQPGLSPLADASYLRSTLSEPVSAGGTELPAPEALAFAPAGGAAEALLMQFTFQGLSVARDAPVRDVVQFRRDNQAGLDRLRAAVGDLVSVLNDEYESYEAFEQSVRDIYANHVRPKINDLRKLRSRALRESARDLWKAVACATSPSLLSLAPLSVAPPVGIALGAGAALSVMAVSCQARLQTLRENEPFSVVLSAERELRRRNPSSILRHVLVTPFVRRLLLVR
jgi:hypothetical protein